MNGLFIRNCNNYNEFMELLKIKSVIMKNYTYVIKKRIEVSAKKFDSILSNFTSSDFLLINNQSLMSINQNDELSCLEVYSREFNFSIVVYSAGYDYYRYVHIKF